MIAILGVKPVEIHSRKNIYLLQILLAAAKKAITIKWLKKETPNYSESLTILKNIYTMEKIIYVLRLQNDFFIDRWTPLMSIIGDQWD